MSNLRWSLLIIGALLLLAVYLYGRWRGQSRDSEVFRESGRAESDILLGGENKSEQFKSQLDQIKQVGKSRLFSELGAEPAGKVTIPLKPSDLQGSLQPLADQPAVRPTLVLEPAEALPEPPAPVQVETLEPEVATALRDAAELQQDRETGSAQKAAAAETGGDMVIIMHIVAPKGSPFSGKAVLKAFHANALRFGDMKVFHRVSKREGKLITVFSVANMLKPGKLDPKDIVNTELQGLSLFTRLPNQAGNIVAFDEMLHCAQHIASTLGGELRDQKLRPLTHGSIMILRGNLRKRFPGQL